MKLPKMPTIVTTRDNGKKEIVGLTPTEWGQSVAALCFLYIVLSGYFIALLFIAQKIRGDRNTYVPPGTEDGLDIVDPDNED